MFINQGLNLSYAFNHAESGRAFREAARLDPTLAMAQWGQALVLGPNINAAMEPTDEAPAYAAIKKAVSLKAGASLRERALIDALAQRYTGKPEDRVARDQAYAAAMRKVHAAVPGRQRHRHALRRVGDGSAAVGLLDAAMAARTRASLKR